MGLRKRAFIYVKRNKGRCTVIFCLLFVMVLAVIVGYAIKTSVDDSAEDFRKSLLTGFTVTADAERVEGMAHGYTVSYIGMGDNPVIYPVTKTSADTDYTLVPSVLLIAGVLALERYCSYVIFHQKDF